jgi:hypothetical protein
MNMKKHDISKMNVQKKAVTASLNRQVAIRMADDTIGCFKETSEETRL